MLKDLMVVSDLGHHLVHSLKLAHHGAYLGDVLVPIVSALDLT